MSRRSYAVFAAVWGGIGLCPCCRFATIWRPSSHPIPFRDHFNEVTASGIIVLGVFPEGLVPGIRMSARGAAPCRKNSQTSFLTAGPTRFSLKNMGMAAPRDNHPSHQNHYKLWYC